MNPIEQARFTPLYEQMLQALKLQGKRPKTIEAYSRGVRRVAGFYQRCPDTLSAAELKTYFASLLETHSWSTIKLDRNGLQFFCKHVLNKQWEWIDIVKPSQERPLPDILTQEETFLLINTVHKLRYRVFFLSVYSMGLRLGEGLQLQVGDIDARSNKEIRALARLSRLNAAGVAQHNIQRGNNRQICFSCEDDFSSYLTWLAESSAKRDAVNKGLALGSDRFKDKMNAD